MPTLPWYYLGDISTTLYHDLSTAGTDCGTVVTTDVIQGALTNAAGGNRPPDGHRALSAVHSVVNAYKGQNRRKDWAGWGPWPGEIEIKVRSEFPRTLPMESGSKVALRLHDYILGPSHLVLPWPFRGFNKRPGRFDVQVWDPDEDYNPATDILCDMTLLAADYLVDPPEGTPQGTRPGDKAARSKLIRAANKPLPFRGFSLPKSVEVVVKGVPMSSTRFEIGAGRMTLVLGTEPVPDDKALLPAYPCSAFGSG